MAPTCSQEEQIWMAAGLVVDFLAGSVGLGLCGCIYWIAPFEDNKFFYIMFFSVLSIKKGCLDFFRFSHFYFSENNQVPKCSK